VHTMCIYVTKCTMKGGEGGGDILGQGQRARNVRK
jgi:hypothetical protein